MASVFLRFLAVALFCLSFDHVFVRVSEAGLVDIKMIAQACEATRSGQACLKWLQDNENDQELEGFSKSDLNSIAFFALKKIEKEAVGVSAAVDLKLTQENENMAPATQQGLSDCKDHYLPAVDLIEDAVEATANNKYPDAIKYLKASTFDLNACQKSLNKLQFDAATGKPTKADEHATMAINHRDTLALHVTMTQRILELASAGSPSAPAAAAPGAAPPTA